MSIHKRQFYLQFLRNKTVNNLRKNRTGSYKMKQNLCNVLSMLYLWMQPWYTFELIYTCKKRLYIRYRHSSSPSGTAKKGHSIHTTMSIREVLYIYTIFSSKFRSTFTVTLNVRISKWSQYRLYIVIFFYNLPQLYFSDISLKLLLPGKS